MAKVWTQDMAAADALDLPTGRLAANLGLWVEQTVSPDNVLMAAQALKDSGKIVATASQAGLMVKAQEAGVAFESWGQLKVM